MAGRHCNRKETYAFTEADYTPGAYSTLILSTSMGLSGNIHRVVVDQSALDAAGGQHRLIHFCPGGTSR